MSCFVDASPPTLVTYTVHFGALVVFPSSDVETETPKVENIKTDFTGFN